MTKELPMPLRGIFSGTPTAHTGGLSSVCTLPWVRSHRLWARCFNRHSTISSNKSGHSSQLPPPVARPSESKLSLKLSRTKRQRKVWESQSNPQFYRDQVTFQGCTVNSHRAGSNFPNAQFNHLSKTVSKNKPAVMST